MGTSTLCTTIFEGSGPGKGEGRLCEVVRGSVVFSFVRECDGRLQRTTISHSSHFAYYNRAHDKEFSENVTCTCVFDVR